MEHQALMKRFDDMKRNMSDKGIKFGSRVLLIGPPGTDFEAFTHYLCREVPLKLVRFRIEELLKESKRGPDILRVGFEFARRNSPTIMLVDRLDNIAPRNTAQSVSLQNEMSRTSWDENEVLVIATTTQPQFLDLDILATFDKTYVIEGTSIEDRVRLFEQVLKGREDIDISVVAELTDGWSFADVKRLATSLFMTEREEGVQIPREKIEDMISNSGVVPLTNPTILNSVIARVSGKTHPTLTKIEQEYPDDFLDQLYLMAVGENYTETQRVIEVLNDGMPLSKEDRGFLARYPFLLNGTPEDRLTRLLRAKKSSDRLQRIMGR